jgi:hypothetical protein
MPEDTTGPPGRSSNPSKARAESSADSYNRQLMELRTEVLEILWNNETEVIGLLNDAGLKPNDYSLDGGAKTLWANLIPVLKYRGELAQVLRALKPRMGKELANTVEELANYFEKERLKRAYDRMRNRLHQDTEVALALLWEAPNHQTTLLMPVHPSAGRIAGMRSWITGCVKAVAKAQKSGEQVSYEDEVGEIENIARQLAAVSDAFRMYASMLERFRSTNDAEPGQPPRPLAAVAEEERLLLGWRTSLRSSIQQLIAVLRSEN